MRLINVRDQNACKALSQDRALHLYRRFFMSIAQLYFLSDQYYIFLLNMKNTKESNRPKSKNMDIVIQYDSERFLEKMPFF